MPRKPTTQALGDCYEAAAKYMMSNSGSKDLILVHAEVMGQGQIEGLTFGHAFIIDDMNVIDVSNGKNLVMPKTVYYAIGGIDFIGNEYRYNRKQLLDKITTFGHWGPWELETKSGL